MHFYVYYFIDAKTMNVIGLIYYWLNYWHIVDQDTLSACVYLIDPLEDIVNSKQIGINYSSVSLCVPCSLSVLLSEWTQLSTLTKLLVYMAF